MTSGEISAAKVPPLAWIHRFICSIERCSPKLPEIAIVNFLSGCLPTAEWQALLSFVLGIAEVFEWVIQSHAIQELMEGNSSVVGP